MGKAVRGDPPYPPALDRPAARRSRSCLSRKGDRVSKGNGRSRALWTALPKVRRKDSAHSLRGQRNELLCPMPNWRKGSCGPRFVPAVRSGLAAHPRRTRSPQAPLKVRTLLPDQCPRICPYRQGSTRRKQTKKCGREIGSQLRCVPVERVDFPRAGVANHQRRIIRSYSEPIVVSRPPETLQTY